VLPVGQVLEQLPEGLAIAVLSAPSAGLHDKLSEIPASLHPLAAAATLFSIHRHRSLTLDFDSPVGKGNAYELLHAVTTATGSMKKISLKHIPVQKDNHLLELIPAACKSASDVALDYGHRCKKPVPDLQHIVQLGAALSHNSALTNLHFTIQGRPGDDFRLDSLTDALTGLQSLSLIVVHSCPLSSHLPAPEHMLHLTHLQLGCGFNLSNLPQILPHLTRLQTLHLSCERLQQLPPLAALTVLQTLTLQLCKQLQELPLLATLTALQTLALCHCQQLQQLPPLATLTALQTLILRDCEKLQQLPPLATLTALQTLTLIDCNKLQQLPPLATLTALKTLQLAFCEQLQELPPLATLTALQTLNLRQCKQLQQLPPLATLTALQSLILRDCSQLQQLPSLATLTSLQLLGLRGCARLQTDSLQLPSEPVYKSRPSEYCRSPTLQVFLDKHIAAPTELGKHSGGSGESPVGAVADVPLGRPSTGFRFKRFINKLRCASCFRFACCGVSLKASSDELNP
jgi:hypothetical protein